MTWVVLEYPEPVAPHNRRVFDCGAGPLTFEADREGAAAYARRLGANSPFRVVEIEWARKAGLLGEEPKS